MAALPLLDLPPLALETVAGALSLRDAAKAAVVCTQLRDATEDKRGAVRAELDALLHLAINGSGEETMASGVVGDGVWFVYGFGDYRRVYLVHLPPEFHPDINIKERAAVAAFAYSWKYTWLAGRVGMGPPHIFYKAEHGGGSMDSHHRMGFVPHRTRYGLPAPRDDAASLDAVARLRHTARLMLQGTRPRQDCGEYPNDTFVL